MTNVSGANAKSLHTAIKASLQKPITITGAGLAAKSSADSNENQAGTSVPAFTAQTYAPTTTTSPLAANALVAGQLKAPVPIPDIGTGGIGVFGDGKGIESIVPYNSIPNTSPMQSNIWPMSSPLPHIPLNNLNKENEGDSEEDSKEKSRTDTPKNQSQGQPNANPQSQSTEVKDLQAKNKELEQKVEELSKKVNGTGSTTNSSPNNGDKNNTTDSKSTQEESIDRNILYNLTGQKPTSLGKIEFNDEIEYDDPQNPPIPCGDKSPNQKIIP